MILLISQLSSLLLFAQADTSVHILSEQYGNGQLITSSTLNWIPDSHYSASKNFVIGGFEFIENSSEDLSQMKKRPIFVCRSLHNGIWVAGGQKEGDKRCTVTLTGNVHSYERYQLLENVESAARVNWNDWTKFYRPPVGSVATDKLYIARYIANKTIQDRYRSSQTHYIGTLNSQDTLGTITYVKEDGNEGSAEIGQLLVETEPISYELNTVLLNHIKKRVVKKSPRILSEITIKNNGPTPVKMAEAIGYTYLYTLYWGQGHAMLKGLSTNVTLQNKTRLPDMKWGIDIRENRTSVYSVETYLKPGTAVNVTLCGYDIDIEVPYSGKLFSHYKDGAFTDPRMISGVRREEIITDISPKFGPIYYLSNFSLAPKNIITSITDSTTTMKMMMITNHQQLNDQFDFINNDLKHHFEKKNFIINENVISSSAKRLEATNMRDDDGNPLSLKGKNENSQSVASNFRIIKFPLLIKIIVTLLMLLLNRVT